MMGTHDDHDQSQGQGDSSANQEAGRADVCSTARPVKVAAKEDPRKALAAWMTPPDNPYFARAMANWVWAQLFGKGLVDPPDDMSRANPPVHPELLDALAKHFVAGKYRPARPDPNDRRLRDLRPVVGHRRRQRARHAALLAPAAAAADRAPDGRRPGPGDRRAQSLSRRRPDPPGDRGARPDDGEHDPRHVRPLLPDGVLRHRLRRRR